MKMMTYYNAMRKAEMDVEIYESHLPANLGCSLIWKSLMRAIRQQSKFTDRLIKLIEKRDIELGVLKTLTDMRKSLSKEENEPQEGA